VIESIPSDWHTAVLDQLGSVDLGALDSFVAKQRQEKGVYPPAGLEFEALRLTRLTKVKAVILGQDPYHQPDQAHGLAFSTLARKRPPSLRNILQEWHDDCHFDVPEDGSLVAWAEHGVLLLNTALTVRRPDPNGTHAAAWKPFTSAIIQVVAAKSHRVAFLLWGAAAMDQAGLIDATRHNVIRSSHPSPLSFKRSCGDAPPFAGSRPFSAANVGLASPVCWSLERADP
jgi:uracil-DNA glycosylase